MSNYNEKYFASIRDNETVYVLYHEDGQPVTRIRDSEFIEHPGYIYDAVSGFGTEHEHPIGIVLTNEDAKLLNLEFIDFR